MSKPSELVKWLGDRPKWLQAAAMKLYLQSEFSENDIKNLTDLCIKEAKEEISTMDCLFIDKIGSQTQHQKIHLKSIDKVSGINALSPRKPLQFGQSNLSIVYGSNASGKSGYVRIIKNVCGAKRPGKLLHDVFKDKPEKQRCDVSYVIDGSDKKYEWVADSGPIKELQAVDVFDSHSAKFYVTSENEVTYEPKLLSFFSDLISLCEKVNLNIESFERELPSKKPTMPIAFVSTPSHKWYQTLKSATSKAEIESYCNWTQEDKDLYSSLNARLASQNPAEQSKKLLTQKKHLDEIINELKLKTKDLTKDSGQKILDSKNIIVQKKKAVDAVAEKVFKKTNLRGVGNDTWMELWRHAKSYSDSTAYVGKIFPVVEKDSLCVLCQQNLSDEAKERLLSFEDYVRSEANRELEDANKSYNKLIEPLQSIWSETELKTKADASNVSQDSFNKIKLTYDQIRSFIAKISEFKSLDQLPSFSDFDQTLSELQSMSTSYGNSAIAYEKDSKSEDQKQLKLDFHILEAKKWLFDNKKTIEDEVNRLEKIEHFANSKKLTSTTVISKKKGDLAEELITEAFVDRFNAILKNLGGSKIRIQLVKTRTEKGRVLHQLKLIDAPTVSVDEILSEGEYRVVSLATFLADVEGQKHLTPFVFDDPITSLDQDYEELVVKLLVGISKQRQVIVFTHRISLLVLLQDYAKKGGIDPAAIYLRKEPWGAGEPGETPIFAKRPIQAINLLMSERLPRAKKTLEEFGNERYEIDGHALCADIRIVLEKMIEHDLLFDIVQRFRRSVQTINKIEKLSRIKEDDCKFFDQMMTKYSIFEHSQPIELPSQLPLPDELLHDLEKIKKWHDEFVK